MTLKWVLDIPRFDIDDDGDVEDFRFVMDANLRLGHQQRTGYLIEGGSNVIDVLTDLLEDVAGTEQPSDGKGQQFLIDLGGGEHVTEIEGQISKDSSNRWGTGDGHAVWDQTGAKPHKQIQLLDRVLQLAEIDSRGAPADSYDYPDGHAAQLSIGMYGEEFPAMNVAPEQPEVSFDAEQESSTATVSMACVELASLGTAVSQKQNTS